MCLPLRHLEANRLAKGEHRGFEWEVVHNGIGYRCGYVKVAPGHPWFGRDFAGIDAPVHGGLTFAAFGTACPTHGAQDEWWVGFACGHAGDAVDLACFDEDSLNLRKFYEDRAPDTFATKFGYTIKSTEYVRAQCLSLCEQASRAVELE